MSFQRIGLIGLLFVLGGCSMAPARHVPPPSARIAAPAAAAPPMTIAPIAAPAIAPASAPTMTSAVSPADPAMTTPPSAPAIAPMPVAPPPPSQSVAHVASHGPAVAKKSVPAERHAAFALSRISGKITLDAGHGQPVGAGESAETLVYFVPDDGGQAARPGHYAVYTQNRDFSPEAMAVPVGSTVTFVNLDDVRHNVFSVTPGSNFDLGYQGTGQKASHVFARPGLVLVGCKVHRSMELDMLIVPTAYSVKAADDGSFTLQGLPPGAGTLYFWNPRAKLTSRALVLPLAGPITQRLFAIRPSMTATLEPEAAP